MSHAEEKGFRFQRFGPDACCLLPRPIRGSPFPRNALAARTPPPYAPGTLPPRVEAAPPCFPYDLVENLRRARPAKIPRGTATRAAIVKSKSKEPASASGAAAMVATPLPA